MPQLRLKVVAPEVLTLYHTMGNQANVPPFVPPFVPRFVPPSVPCFVPPFVPRFVPPFVPLCVPRSRSTKQLLQS